MGPIQGYFNGPHKLQEKMALFFLEITQMSRVISYVYVPDFKYLQTQVAVIVLLTQVDAQINGIKILT